MLATNSRESGISSKRAQKRKTHFGWIVVALAVSGLISTTMTFTRSNRGDIETYNKAAERLIVGESIYRYEDNAFTYPPFCALLYVFTTGCSELARGWVWYFVNIWVLLLTLFLLMREFRVRNQAHVLRRRPKMFWWFICGTLILSARFLMSSLGYQSNHLVVFLLMMLAIRAWGRKDQRQAGIWVGVGVAFRAVPLLFLPVFLCQRQFRASIWLVVTATLATLIPDLLFPSADGSLWIASWFKTFVSKVSVGVAPDVEGTWGTWNLFNQSLVGLCYRLFLLPPPTEDFNCTLWVLSPGALRITTTALLGGVFGVLLWIVSSGRSRVGAKQPEQRTNRLPEGSLVLCGTLLLSPMTSKHHFSLLVVPTALFLWEIVNGRQTTVIVGALVVMSVFGSFLGRDLIGKHWDGWLLAWGNLTWLTLVCFGASGYLLLKREARINGKKSKVIQLERK